MNTAHTSTVSRSHLLLKRSLGMLKRAWRRIAPILLVSGFYYGVLVYPVLRIWNLLSPEPPGTPALLLVMVGPLLGRLAYEFFPGTLTRWLSMLTLTWLGICFMAFGIVIGFELLRLVLPLEDTTWGALLLGATVTLGIYAIFNAQRLSVKSIPVQIDPGINVALSGAGALSGAPGAAMRIAQISDVHVGSRSGRFLRRVVRKVNNEQADIILITGDLIDFKDISITEIGALGELNAPAYFFIGNHERYVDTEAICERLRALGLFVLRNESIELGNLQLIGIDDAEAKSQVRSELAKIPPVSGKYRILLYHRPDGAHDAAQWGAHLMLCGHTHNGQIIPFNLLVKRIFPRICGLYEVDALKLYVSPGTGTWGPVLRLGSRCEISMIELNATPNQEPR